MRAVRLMMLVASIAGCSGGGGGGGTGTAVFTTLLLTSSSSTAYEFGTATTMTLTAKDQTGATMAIGSAVPTWTVTPSGIASVNGSNVLVVTSGTPSNLTVSADLTLQGITKTSNAVPISTDLAAAVAAVITVGTSFSPSTVDIKVGGVVNWSGLSGGLIHNVDFLGSATPFPGNTTLNGPPGSSSTASGSFASTGSFGYQCDFHGAAMSGTVVVH